MKSVPPLRVVARRSKSLMILAGVASFITATLMLTLPMPWWARGALAGLCVLFAVLEFVRARRGAPCELIVGLDRTCRVLAPYGRALAGEVLDPTYVTGWFTALVWRPHGSWLPRTIALPPGAMRPEDVRRLRVWLRFSQPPGAEEDAPPSTSGVTAGRPASHAAASMRTPLSSLG